MIILIPSQYSTISAALRGLGVIERSCNMGSYGMLFNEA